MFVLLDSEQAYRSLGVSMEFYNSPNSRIETGVVAENHQQRHELSLNKFRATDLTNFQQITNSHHTNSELKKLSYFSILPKLPSEKND